MDIFEYKEYSGALPGSYLNHRTCLTIESNNDYRRLIVFVVKNIYNYILFQTEEEICRIEIHDVDLTHLLKKSTPFMNIMKQMERIVIINDMSTGKKPFSYKSPFSYGSTSSSFNNDNNDDNNNNIRLTFINDKLTEFVIDDMRVIVDN